MIIDLTVKNFKSFQSEQVFSLNVEGGYKHLDTNYSNLEAGKLKVLRSAAIFGPNASGKSNLMKAFKALTWMVTDSKSLDEDANIPTFDPFVLGDSNEGGVTFEVEFIVPSGIRYRYAITFDAKRVTSEALYSYPKRHPALVFSREPNDTWETVKFGGSYKGGARRIPFFPNRTYLSQAGNDPAAPKSIREIVAYFRSFVFIDAGTRIQVTNYFQQSPVHLKTIAELVSLADTGVENITIEETGSDHIVLPKEMPEDLRAAIIAENSVSYKFWQKSQSGDLVKFDRSDMSDGTLKLFEQLPLILSALVNGAPIFVDEIDGHLHTQLVSLILDLFNDPIANEQNAQIIFTTHDTNLLNPNSLRRDQIWFTQKSEGETMLYNLDEFDKTSVRQDSPYEDYYKDGRLGALPNYSYSKIRSAIGQLPKQRSIFLSASDYA